MYRIKTTYKGYTSSVTRGSAEGGGIRYFKTRREAEYYASKLDKSFNAQVVKKQSVQKSRSNVFGLPISKW